MSWSLLSVIPLGVLVVSDVRSRTVSSWWLLALGFVLWVNACVAVGLRPFIIQVLGNAVLFLTIGAAVYAYLRVRKKDIRSMLGLGDVLFLVAVLPVFEMIGFLWYLIISCTLALFVWPVCRRLQPNLAGIPLVSVFGTCLAVFIVLQ